MTATSRNRLDPDTVITLEHYFAFLSVSLALILEIVSRLTDGLYYRILNAVLVAFVASVVKCCYYNFDELYPECKSLISGSEKSNSMHTKALPYVA